MNDEAVEIIGATMFAVLATSNEDGSPYATPVTYTFNDGILSWRSQTEAVHSQNIARDGRVSLVILEGGRAVYINSVARATGEMSFDERWQKDLAHYEVPTGALDEEKSQPGRLYFRGVTV